MNKITKTISSLILTSLFLFNFSFAELNVLWFTKTFNVQVGDSVKIDIYVEPQADHPVVTVSHTLNYDTSKLKFKSAYFPDSWTELGESPNFLNDEKNGFIRRTGGMANGIYTNVKYITYEFEAVNAGDANLFIEDGFALDQESTDIGFENKKMLIRILPKVESETISTSTSTLTSTSTSISQTPKVVPPSLDISGKTAIYEGADYNIKIYADPSETGNSLSNVKLSLLNNLGETVYSAQNSFTINNQKSLEFTIPKSFFETGDYTLYLKTTYKNSKNQTLNEIVKEKEIGVLPSGKSYFDVHKIEFLSLFGLIVFIAFIYHIHRDHIIFRKLRARAGEYHELRVEHKE
jgi:hypothetical protein